MRFIPVIIYESYDVVMMIYLIGKQFTVHSSIARKEK